MGQRRGFRLANKKPLKFIRGLLERATGFEPVTFSLARRRYTTKPRPPINCVQNLITSPMSCQVRIGLILWLAFTLLACTLTRKSEDKAAPLSLPTAPVMGVDDATYLLQDVCFEALLLLDGQTFVWKQQSDLDQFMATLNIAEVCATDFVIPSFDFSEQMVVGAVQSAQDCDAEFVPTVQHERQQTLILLQFIVEAGCAYELIASYVAAIPAGTEVVIMVD